MGEGQKDREVLTRAAGSPRAAKRRGADRDALLVEGPIGTVVIGLERGHPPVVGLQELPRCLAGRALGVPPVAGGPAELDELDPVGVPGARDPDAPPLEDRAAAVGDPHGLLPQDARARSPRPRLRVHPGQVLLALLGLEPPAGGLDGADDGVGPLGVVHRPARNEARDLIDPREHDHGLPVAVDEVRVPELARAHLFVRPLVVAALGARRAGSRRRS